MLWFGAVQDGNLRVFKWPSMEIVFSEAKAHTTVKQLDFRFVTIEALGGKKQEGGKKKKISTFFICNAVGDGVAWLSCSPDGKFLVSLGQSGPGRVWDVPSSTVVASLPTEKVSNYWKLFHEENCLI